LLYRQNESNLNILICSNKTTALSSDWLRSLQITWAWHALSRFMVNLNSRFQNYISSKNHSPTFYLDNCTGKNKEGNVFFPISESSSKYPLTGHLMKSQ